MKRWRYITLEDVLSIHNVLIERFGGASGVRDEALLDSALAQPAQTFDGIDLYPTMEEKAARYAYGIINNHPFVDGNKRAGAAALGMFLRANGRRFKPRHDELYETILGVADGSVSYDDLVKWVQKQCQGPMENS